MASKKLRLTAVLLAGVSGCATSSSSRARIADDAWSAFAPPDCRCSVEFPGTPKPAPSTVETSAGPMLNRAYDLAIGQDLAFRLQWSEFPVILADRDAIEGVFRGAAEERGRRLLRLRKSDISGFPGMRGEWRAEGRTTMMRMMLVGMRQYELLVVGADRAFDREAAARFLASFKLADAADERRRADAQLLEQEARFEGEAAKVQEAVERASDAPTTPAWIAPAGAGFRAWMPAKAEATTMEMGAGVAIDMHVAMGKDVNCIVMAMRGGGRRDEAATRARLAGMVDELLAPAGLTASSRTPTEWRGRPALVVKAAGDGARAELLLTADDARIFVVMATMGEEAPGDAEARRFLDSFELIPATPPPPR